MQVSTWVKRAAFAAALVALVGCKRDAVRVLLESLDFGDTASVQQMDVWNGDPELDMMEVEFKPSDPWILVDPGSVSSGAPRSATEGFDKRGVTVSIDRTQLVGDRAEGSIVISGPRVKELVIPVYVSPPYQVLASSVASLDFGPVDDALAFEVWKANPRVFGLNLVSVTASAPWLAVHPGILLSIGQEVHKTITATVDRSKLSTGENTAEIRFQILGYADKVVPVTAFQRIAAIGVSNESLDFGLDARPWEMDVWNDSSQIGLLGVQIVASASWLHVAPSAVSSAAPSQGGLDKQLVTVYIDRTGIAIGEYQGYLDLIPDRSSVSPRRIPVSFRQDADSPAGGLFIDSVQHRYSPPYLLEFSLGLRDAAGNAIVTDPDQLAVTAYEEGRALAPGTEPIVKRGAARQLRADLVLDYSAFMQAQSGAVVAMEQAARDLFLPALNDEALVGVTAYYRDDYPDAARVADFSTDRAWLRDRINAIQTEYVNGFSSGARALDALFGSIQRFSEADASNEDRYIVFLSSGLDTSSTHTVNDVVSAANARAVRIHAIGFGASPDGAMLYALTSGTGGRRYDAQRPETLGSAFTQIVDHLGGQYVLRWATLRRDSVGFTPSFRVALGAREGQYTEADHCTASVLSGDVVGGLLRLVTSLAGDSAAVVIRADYMPRAVARLRLYVRSGLTFTASLVDAADDGLLGGWTLTRTPDPNSSGFFLDITSPGDPARFADFGPLLRLDFAGVNADPVTLLEDISVDNTVYDAGQHFTIVNPN